MLKSVDIDISGLQDFVDLEELFSEATRAVNHKNNLTEGKGKGSDFLGWLDLPVQMRALTDGIVTEAERLAGISEFIVVVGIGGSYLGARAVYEALGSYFPLKNNKGKSKLLFAGHNLCEDYIKELTMVLKDADFSVIVVSKSGTTTEPAISFRILKQLLEEKGGKEYASKRIVAITDPEKGALRKLATENNYKIFTIPGDVGGRYSVLTAAGLLPLAASGTDIRELLKGASDMRESFLSEPPERNQVLIYAAARNLLLARGYNIEILANYAPKLSMFMEWWKQLFGESEGKEGKGIFPAAVNFTSDLHSMGQYIQEGQRIMFETIIDVTAPSSHLTVPTDKDNYDQLNYLSGKRISEINRNALLGTFLAHGDGGVPCIIVKIPEVTPYYIGQLIYFFEVSCAVSGYILDVNPFDQPGVEAYKNNMFALLNKPGHEKDGEALRKRLDMK